MLIRNINKINKSKTLINLNKCYYASKKNNNNIFKNETVDGEHQEIDEINDEKYLQIYSSSREEMINNIRKGTGKQIYEAKERKLTHSIKEYRNEFSGLGNGNKLLDKSVVLVGRIKSIRNSSNKLTFIDLVSSYSNQPIVDDVIKVENNETLKMTGAQFSLQVMADFKFFENQNHYPILMENLRKGDIIEIIGYPAKSQKGELSVIPKDINILTPCNRPIPLKINDKEIRYRNRPLDFLVNPENQRAFFIRSKVINYVRSFLVERGFLEVDTPILSTNVGGANAKPFITRSNSLNLDLFLRISPELFLKQLVVAGFDKVFELGKQFRNEGIDLTHNPEFTTCEFYQAYADYETIVKLTEEMLSGMVYSIFGTYEIPFPANPEIKLNFKAPFQRINFIDKIEELTGRTLPKDLTSYDCIPELLDICRDNNIHCKEPYTPTRILDEMASTLIEPLCIQPTFVIDHPLAMSPLAKIHRSNNQRTERFELFVGGKELVNAYSELNDPKEQRKRFLAQSQDRITGDDEAQILDESFCNALEYGLPPTGGWGLGIDRLCMLFSNTTTIKDVLFFPTMKPIEQKPNNKDTK
ncbi:hypothetical protein DICPUDRAFT_150147 [Dictyostelium purpureum]|uniref:lysine--tRNA ligase n=1 Tax=Dictyostelium purpureum TaxID=5786 RepID=F0ZFK3_DICPU|nr:uncharacterized protein DICPUDRAFT_150147 [Dictyostelium purpureum]EGC37312.1 hypothetical protein DICPUDRAFT_150147 [Dictyostelium purpureum]|eukprot:XP_003286200.1 hypothetical protein DICPUDRAFT_150147 [Dictyostelium purpureum]